MVNTEQLRAKDRETAIERIDSFAQKFSWEHLDLACHAALPLALTPDLLYQIRGRFVRQSPWIAVSDILLSRLCREVSHELYEMDIAVREILLEELEASFGRQRIDELADFLYEYVSEKLKGNDRSTQELALAQEWTVLAYTQSKEAVKQFAEALKSSRESDNLGALVRLTSLAEALAKPLEQASTKLLLYTRGVARWIRGDQAAALEYAGNLPEYLQIEGIELKNITNNSNEQDETNSTHVYPIENGAEEFYENDSEDIVVPTNTELVQSQITNTTSIQTRFGQILDLVTQKVLEACGFNFRQDWQYDKESTKLDFFFENINSSQVFMEATQTDRRDALRMKTLRYFNLVAQAKINFGVHIRAVSLIYGNPSTKLSGATVRSSLSFFDGSLIPREDPVLQLEEKSHIEILERSALIFAQDKIPSNLAASQILKIHPEGVRALERYFYNTLPSIENNPLLRQLWSLEIERNSSLNIRTDLRPVETFYKSGIVKLLFLKEEEFVSLTDSLTASRSLEAEAESLDFDPSLRQKLIELRLARENPSVVSERSITLHNEVSSILKNPKIFNVVNNLRKLLDKQDKAKWYFADIYSFDRRVRMAEIFTEVATQGERELEEALFQNFMQETYAGIQHSRCWLADFISLELDKSQSALNNIVASYPDYDEKIGAFQVIVIKLDGLLNNEKLVRKLCHFISRVWYQQGRETGVLNEILSLKREGDSEGYQKMADRLLQLRLKSAVRLVNFDPLRSLFETTLIEEGWKFKRPLFDSILSDLSEDSKGKFKVYSANKNGIDVILNVLQIIDSHKPQEWAARGRALRYRIQTDESGGKQVVRQLEDAEFVFALDGKVTSKMRRQLERGGWRTCALDELPEVLAEIEARGVSS